MRPTLATTLAALALAVTPALTQTSTPAAAPAEPYLWLEATQSPRALAWVEKQNARSLAVLKGDPRYGVFHEQALAIVNAVDRIPTPELIGEAVYNFWQDPANVRGLWRRATAASYAGAAPAWESVIDLDALAATEKANWVWKGADCPPPHYRLCLVSLSDGGEDATEVREFDLAAKRFVAGGFVLPHSKQTADWIDENTLIVSRDWGAGTMTASGYPFVVKTLKRGQPLAQAIEVFRGQASDVSVDPVVLHDGAGRAMTLIQRGIDFFHTEIWRLTDRGPVKLDLPEKITVRGLLDGALVFTTEQDWAFDGRSYKAGALLALNPARLAADSASARGGESAEPLIFQPGPRQSVEQVEVTKTRIVAAIYDNVRGALVAFEAGGEAGWRQSRLPVTANSSVSIVAAEVASDTLYYDVEGFLDPTRLWRADAASGAAAAIKALPARFDASRDAVDQFEVASSDGTKVPYFVVHPKEMKLDGSNPTLLYAYGGFQVSLPPSYSPTVGKLWLEHGGVYVLANIRGGGEFG
ncbi:MAG: S9 family peptidase, partial [Caulobacteraceae bacterium]